MSFPHTGHQYPSANVDTDTKNYNSTINLGSVKTTGVGNV